MFICVENDTIIGMQEFEPNVPESVKVYEINDAESANILAGTHAFDLKKKKVLPIGSKKEKELEAEKEKFKCQEFLYSTDWKVMRHIRETALNMLTTLSSDEYLKLERERHIAAQKISKT